MRPMTKTENGREVEVEKHHEMKFEERHVFLRGSWQTQGFLGTDLG